MLVRRIQGNQILYQANSESPIFPEVRSLIAKTVGVHDAIRSSLAALESEVQIAFIYGSVARQSERANSDVDLMVLGKAPFGEIVAALAPVQQRLSGEVNPTVYSMSEFRSKWKSENHFLRSVMADKKLFIVGTEHDLAKLLIQATRPELLQPK